uniref:TFIIS-type domain-containing protein n=1 Tax=viral metagenome TaxID=1070528 RepID=A0A6C0B8R5_9ZZZZ
MQTISNPDTFRSNIRDKIIPILGDEKISSNLEIAIYNYAIKEANSRKIIKKWDNPYFVQLYVDHLRSIYFNLKNKELLDQIKSGEITVQALAFMTHQELNPAHWSKLIEQKIKRDSNKFTTNIQASTDMFTCKKCRSKKCTYYELQTRSADEPATIFVTCLDCGKHWKS